MSTTTRERSTGRDERPVGVADDDPSGGAAPDATAPQQPARRPVTAKRVVADAQLVRHEIAADKVGMMSAAVAFYALLAMVPALIAMISIAGLFMDPAAIEQQVDDALSAAPSEVRDLVAQQLQSIASRTTGQALFTAVLGVVLALWSASGAMGHLVDAVNIAYDTEDRRSWLKRKLLALGLTVGAVLFVATAFALIALLPAVVASTGLGTPARVAMGALRWVVLLGGVLLGFAVLYRIAPDRDGATPRWITPGAVIGAVLWLAGSALFSFYAGTFGSYNETYGSLGAVVVTMLWLMITAYAVILGAEINQLLESRAV